VVGPGEVVQFEVAEEGSVIEIALDGGAMHRRELPFLAPAEGDHWLTLLARDGVGNTSLPRWLRLRVDSQSPTLHLRFNPEPVASPSGTGRWLPPGSEARLSAMDDLSGVSSLSLEAGDKVERSAGGGLTLGLPEVGSFTVVASARDGVGNESMETVTGLAIDAAGPTGEGSWRGPAVDSAHGKVVAPSARLSFAVQDAASGVAEWEPQIDGAVASPSALEEDWQAGPHRVRLLARDRVGNLATLGPWRFEVDAAGPEISWRVASPGVSASDGRVFYPAEVTLELAASDALAGVASFENAEDDGVYHLAPPSMLVRGNKIRLRAEDRVGNKSAIEASWLVDVEGPQLTIKGPEGRAVAGGETLGLTLGEKIDLRAEDAGIGLGRATYRLNRSRAQPLPATLCPTFKGRVLLTIEAEDLMGNRSSQAWYLWVTDPGKEG
jgi:hypothetical protein